MTRNSKVGLDLSYSSMHITRFFTYIWVLLFFPTMGWAQELELVQNHLNTVETGKVTFRQELRSLDDGLVQYSLVEVDTKGREKEIQYIFGPSDIDQNTVRALTKKDVIIVQLLVSGKQKLVQMVSNGGDKLAYTDKLQLYASDSENGKQLEKAVKELIPVAIKKEGKRLALSSFGEHMDWLLENIADVELPSKQIVQKTSTSDIPGQLFLEQFLNTKSKTRSQSYQLNLSTLNPNSVGYKITGEELVVSVGTRRGIKGIKYSEDGEQKSYTNTLRLYAKSITNGKDIYKVLKKVIPLAEEAFENNRTDVSSAPKALKFVNAVASEVSISKGSITQNLSMQENVAQLKQTFAEPEKSTEYLYQLNFGDINANNVDYDGQKNLLFTRIPTKKSVKFVKVIKNGELQNYDKDTKVYFTSIEDAIVGTEALKTLANLQGEKMGNISYSSSTTSEAVEKLKTLMQKVKIGEDGYDLYIELIDAKTNTLKITTVFSNLKKSTETVQEFSLNDINPKNCTIKVKGKHVVAELNTNHLEKIVKTYVDGEIKPYQYKVEIEAKGIEEARQIVGTIESISEKIK